MRNQLKFLQINTYWTRIAISWLEFQGQTQMGETFTAIFTRDAIFDSKLIPVQSCHAKINTFVFIQAKTNNLQ